MDLKNYDIAAGAVLHAVRSDKFKTDFISINFINRLDDKTASLYSLLSKVLCRGTASMPTTAEFSKKLDYLYASSISMRITKRGDALYVSLVSNMLSEAYVPQGTRLFEQVFEVIREVLFEPYTENGVFKPEYVECEKRNLIDDIRSVINNKAAYANRRCIEEMCANELYSVSQFGSEETVRGIGPEELWDAYLHFISESKVEAYLIGSADPDLAATLLRGAFSTVRRAPADIPPTEVIRKAESVRRLSEHSPTAQSKLVLGFRSGKVLSDGDFSKFTVFTEVYGAGSSSKLFLNVREKMSLCYYCSAQALSQKGIMLVYSGIDADKKEAAESEILRQLELTAAGNINEEELENAKKAIVSDYRAICDSPAGMEAWLISRIDNGLDTSIEAETERVMTVSAQDVAQTAAGISLDTIFFLEGGAEGEENGDDE